MRWSSFLATFSAWIDTRRLPADLRSQQLPPYCASDLSQPVKFTVLVESASDPSFVRVAPEVN
jgi:hypothetical protein